MRGAQLALLAGVAVLALALALALGRQPADPPASGERLLPGLADAVNDVTAVVVQPGGEPPVRIERGEAAWTVPGRHGYPADAGKVRRLVLRLADARKIETKTSSPALYPRLGVEDVTGAGGGVAVSLEGVEAGTVIVGNRETPGGRGTYVRLADEETAWLVDQDLAVDAQDLEWLDREIMDVPAAEVVSIEITHPDGDRVAVERGEDGRLGLANLPAGRAPAGPTAADALARALAGLRLDDVRPAAAIDAGSEPVRARFTLADGTAVEATSREDDDAVWVVFDVVTGPPSGDGAPGRAEALAGRVSGWAYRLPAWKTEQLRRRLDDLLAPATDAAAD